MFFLFNFGFGGGFDVFLFVVLSGNLLMFFCFRCWYFLLLFFFWGGVGGDFDFFKLVFFCFFLIDCKCNGSFGVMFFL